MLQEPYDPILDSLVEELLTEEESPKYIIKLSDRWAPLTYHEIQQRAWESAVRFIIITAGRRSGKTELAKRRIIQAALSCAKPNGRFICAAPTHGQAYDIYWDDLIEMIPREFIVGEPSKSKRTIRLINGARISVLGLDKPQRVEGSPIDGIIIDEYADMKPEVWSNHVRPALDTLGREGWAWLIGVPEGRNHYYDLWLKAISGDDPDWEGFTWFSADILPSRIIEAAKRSLDPVTYKQEYEGQFVTFEGRCYYGFSDENVKDVTYDPSLPLIFAFDFNRAPGIAVIIQEQGDTTCVIGEVYIDRNSNTERVCSRLVEQWGHHEGEVHIYGDASGGAQGSAKVKGSDWDIVRYMLRPHFSLNFHLRKANPSIRVRVNALNTRILRGDGKRRLFINGSKAPETLNDIENVRVADDGNPDKKNDPKLTHLTDALGYYVERAWPVSGMAMLDVEL